MNVEEIIEKYYEGQEDLKQLLLLHSQQVARKAMEVLDLHPEISADRTFVYEAAMLHDIGVFRTHAPSIHCHGDAHYIQHGVIGAQLLRAEGLEAHARVCERHIGVGLTVDDIVSQNLPLPHCDMLPETLEEKLVCYADNFFSKSQPDIQRTLAQVHKSIARFGAENEERFIALAQLFGDIDYNK